MVTEASLKQVLAHVRREAWPADLVAMTGDLTQDETPESYRRFRSLFAGLDLPIYCVPGNHDTRPVMERILRDPPFYYCGSGQFGNWLVIGIDSCVDGTAGGRVSESELARLGRMLDDTSADHALICLHHPPLAVGSEWLDGVGLDDAHEFLELISRSTTARAAIFGHVHQDFQSQYEGISIIGTPSTCRQFRKSSHSFALDENPPAYRRITLLPDGTIETELIWLDGQ